MGCRVLKHGPASSQDVTPPHFCSKFFFFFPHTFESCSDTRVFRPFFFPNHQNLSGSQLLRWSAEAVARSGGSLFAMPWPKAFGCGQLQCRHQQLPAAWCRNIMPRVLIDYIYIYIYINKIKLNTKWETSNQYQPVSKRFKDDCWPR